MPAHHFIIENILSLADKVAGGELASQGIKPASTLGNSRQIYRPASR